MLISATSTSSQLAIFSIRVFFGSLHRHWRLTGQQRRGGDHLLFHSTTSTYSQTFRHLFATLHVRWLSRIFNRNDCVYQTASQWDLQPYWITIWLIGWLIITAIWYGKPVDLNSHRLFTLVLEAKWLTKRASHHHMKWLFCKRLSCVYGHLEFSDKRDARESQQMRWTNMQSQ